MANTYPPLFCHTCHKLGKIADALKIKATGATQYLQLYGRRVLHSEVICRHGHKWWSRHKEARKLDKIVDATQEALT